MLQWHLSSLWVYPIRRARGLPLAFYFEKSMKRVAVYIDGFNLYHAIDGLKKPHR